jgi:hypothetical protein
LRALGSQARVRKGTVPTAEKGVEFYTIAHADARGT